MLKKLRINNWNQFGTIDIEFDKRLTVLTGVNGSGKSSLIRIISKVIGWDYMEIAKPNTMYNEKIKTMVSDGMRYGVTNGDLDYLLDRLSKRIKEREREHGFDSEEYDYADHHIGIGELVTGKNEFIISVPKESDEASYSLSMHTLDDTEYEEGNEECGINIPSHRMPYFYNELEYIHSKFMKKIDSYNAYKEELMKRQVTGNAYDSSTSPHANLKSSLITAAIYDDGNKFIRKDVDAKNSFKDFSNILSKLLPESLKFKELVVEAGEIILVTETGEFLLDAVSGGIGAIVDISWQIFMAKPEGSEEDSFYVLIDEIENHLHPSMQRTILPNLLDAFPSVQFIVTTHSPFVVNSVEENSVYALMYNGNKVFSQKLNLKEKYSTALEVLREIMGVPVTMPVWAEKQIEKLIDEYMLDLTVDSYKNLKEEMNKLDLDHFMPYTLSLVSERVNL